MKNIYLSVVTGSIALSSALFMGCSSSSEGIEQAHEVKEFRTSTDPDSWANNMKISGEVSNGADYLTINVAGEANTLTELAHLQVYVDIDNNKDTGYSDGPITFEGTVYEISGADYMIEDDQLFKSTSNTDWEWEWVSDDVQYEISDTTLNDEKTQYERAFTLDLNFIAGYNNSDINVAIEPVDANWQDTNNFISTQTINVNTQVDKPELSEDNDLNEDDKYSLAHMWHEEKLAYEIYLELNKIHPANQFVNIAHNSEVNHIAAVEDLIAAYDINVTNLDNYEIEYSEEELRAMPVGTFTVPKVQELYDTLYAKGIQSPRDAMEVGCMVEVVDIIDLDHFIETSEGKQDLIDTFEYLKDGSYNHYWAFDNAMKKLGAENGCCDVTSIVIGDLGEVNFCKPDYPQK